MLKKRQEITSDLMTSNVPTRSLTVLFSHKFSRDLQSVDSEIVKIRWILQYIHLNDLQKASTPSIAKMFHSARSTTTPTISPQNQNWQYFIIPDANSPSPL